MNKKVLKMVYAAVFAAMVFVLTRFIQIPVPGGMGYLHFGDAMIYLVASTLGGPWALLASAIGAAIADLSSVYAVYAPVSAIVKVLIALPFVLVNKKSEKILTPLTICLTIPSGIITVLGYFVGDCIINKAYDSICCKSSSLGLSEGCSDKSRKKSSKSFGKNHKNCQKQTSCR